MSEQAKKTDAWMPLWIGDYLADTMSLNTAQHGAYLLLLIAYWRNKGPIPDDDDDLATIVRATPSEWKKLRQKMLRFFDVSEGFWTHNRANKELEKAGLFAKKAHERAVRAAAARWGGKQSSSNAPSNAPSNAQAVLDQCPTPSPSPSPITGTQTVVAEDGKDPHSARGGDFDDVQTVTTTSAGVVCKAMRAKGLSDANPGNQKLLTLIDAGATQAEFEGAAEQAVKARAGFAYALSIVANERMRAAQLATQIHRGRMPAAPPPTETAHARKMREAAEGLAGGVARRSPLVAAKPMNVIDLESPHVPAIASH